MPVTRSKPAGKTKPAPRAKRATDGAKAATSAPRRTTTSSPVLTARALNRATLARQLLLERARMPVLDAIEQVIALQAQLPNPPYIGLWARVADFRKEALTELIEKRRVVRSTMMRYTQHLVTARDYLQLRPVVQPSSTRLWKGVYAKRIAKLDLDELLGTAREILSKEARTITEMQAILGARWPKIDANAMAYSVQLLLPLVHVPPRGTWRRGGAVPARTAESWLRRQMSSDDSPEELIVRYLGAFGPASVADASAYSGLTGLRAPFEALRSQLRVFRNEAGKELFDLPDAPLPDPDTPVPPIFLPEYDNTLLAFADRTRVVSDENRKRIWTKNGMLPALLLDGKVAGGWKITRDRKTATLEIQPYGRLSKADRVAASEEGARLLAFTDGDELSHDIRWLAPS